MRQFIASLLEVIEVVVMALGAVFLVRTFLVQPFLVSGESMFPNFSNGDYLLIDEMSYRFRVPERGEVVVFHYPKQESTYFIKRVIGLPGEKIELEGGKVKIINAENVGGFFLDERYLPTGTPTTVHSGNGSEFALGEHQYLVLGDNRLYSLDSRDWGLLKDSEIVGMVRLRLWPPRDFMVFAAPQY